MSSLRGVAAGRSSPWSSARTRSSPIDLASRCSRSRRGGRAAGRTTSCSRPEAGNAGRSCRGAGSRVNSRAGAGSAGSTRRGAGSSRPSRVHARPGRVRCRLRIPPSSAPALVTSRLSTTGGATAAGTSGACSAALPGPATPCGVRSTPAASSRGAVPCAEVAGGSDVLARPRGVRDRTGATSAAVAALARGGVSGAGGGTEAAAAGGHMPPESGTLSTMRSTAGDPSIVAEPSGSGGCRVLARRGRVSAVTAAAVVGGRRPRRRAAGGPACGSAASVSAVTCGISESRRVSDIIYYPVVAGWRR